MARILVVDDNDDVRQLVKSVLVEEGHNVQLAANGETALTTMKNNPPDVVILDIMMPDVDGYTVLKRMTEEGLKKRTKVLVLTAKIAEADWLRGYRLGADQYLTKPFTMDELIRTLNDVLRMTIDQLRKRRAEELEKARLLSRLESSFGDF
ncbi:MAG: two-component system, OmpR family, phosphate regulon response regulator PhoB [Actinomycetota bacterium]|nr:two-component system, OmpR family, phosphate regulon response regulator PhoB [Actinomycetota bacterium]